MKKLSYERRLRNMPIFFVERTKKYQRIESVSRKSTTTFSLNAPTFENNLSGGTNVATMLKYFRAHECSVGYETFNLSQYSIGFSDREITG